MSTSDSMKSLYKGSSTMSAEADDDNSVLKLRDTLSAFRYRISPSKPQSNLSQSTVPRLDECSGSLARNVNRCNPETKQVPTTPNQSRSTSQDNSTSTSGQTSSAWPDDALSLSTLCRKTKKRPKARDYASPEKYKHLNYLQDYLEPYQEVVFCGINPGYQSGRTGYYYAHTTNHFWQCLHLSGLTERLFTPSEAYLLPELYNFGMTNLVDRPTSEQSELSTDEMKEGVPLLMDKLAKYRPRTLCFLGRGIWDIFRNQAFNMKATQPCFSPASSPQKHPRKSSKMLKSPNNPVASRYFLDVGDVSSTPPDLSQHNRSEAKREIRAFEWGLQPFKLVYRQSGEKSVLVSETLIFVMPSTSARVVAYQWWDKVRFFRQLRDHLTAVQNDEIDTCAFTPIPLTTTKSIYFILPPGTSPVTSESSLSNP